MERGKHQRFSTSEMNYRVTVWGFGTQELSSYRIGDTLVMSISLFSVLPSQSPVWNDLLSPSLLLHLLLSPMSWGSECDMESYLSVTPSVPLGSTKMKTPRPKQNRRFQLVIFLHTIHFNWAFPCG